MKYKYKQIGLINSHIDDDDINVSLKWMDNHQDKPNVKIVSSWSGYPINICKKANNLTMI